MAGSYSGMHWGYEYVGDTRTVDVHSETSHQIIFQEPDSSSEAVLQKCFAQENVYPRAIECVPDVVQLSL